MKKIIVILLLGSSLIGFAQQGTGQRKMKQDFTPEQQAILKTKQMALELDLTDAQQKQMLDLNKKWAQERAKQKEEVQNLNKEEMSSDDRFNHMNKMLDQRISHQNSVKKILSEDQYNTWKKSAGRGPHDMKQKMAYHQRKNKMDKK